MRKYPEFLWESFRRKKYKGERAIMENFKKCAIFFMCILLIFGVIGMIRQCGSFKAHEEKNEITNTEVKEEMSDETIKIEAKEETADEILKIDCAAEYSGETYSLGDTRDEILRKAESTNCRIWVETEEVIVVDMGLYLYFDQENICIALSFNNEWIETEKGVQIGSLLKDMLECYGDSYEKISYPEENYEVYRYDHNDHIIKFGVMKEIEYTYLSDERGELPIIQSIEIYDPEKYHPYSQEVSGKEDIDYFVEYKGMRVFLEQKKADIMQEGVKNKIKVMETEEGLMLDEALYLFFDENDVCIRISILNELPKMARGISRLDHLDDVIECYGDNYECSVFVCKGTYKAYRYYNHDYVMEFGFAGTDAGNPTHPLHLDIYHKSAAPIYDYGEPFDYEDF